MRKTLAAAILSSLFASAATASTVPSEADIKRQALAAAYKNAESIACVDPEYVHQEFMTLVPWADLYDRELAEYAVIWNGDIGCAGGSGTTGVHLSIVKVGAGNTFYVGPAQVFAGDRVRVLLQHGLRCCRSQHRGCDRHRWSGLCRERWPLLPKPEGALYPQAR